MANCEHSNPGGRLGWPVRIATAIGAGGAAAIGLVFRPDFGSVWLGLIAFVIVVGTGALLGRLVGGLLFGQSSGEQPEPPPHA
jgi:hypothetical protein